MLASVIFFLFCAILIGCVIAGFSIVYALLAGLLLFIIYGLIKKHSFKSLLLMAVSGIKTVKNILITFILIGMLTALLRASGCIPAIVCYSSVFIKAEIFVLIAFFLNCLVSFLTGTAFGTAATMGVICMSIANTLGINAFWTGGAILSGVFFGDRCSPVSTSALLVSTLTKTDIYKNIKNMIKTAAIPFAITCLIYLAAGFLNKSSGNQIDVFSIFNSEFTISLWCLIPAACILILAIFKCNVKITMGVSIAAAFLISIFVQKANVLNLLKIMVLGYKAEAPELTAIINGGGIVSMIRVTLIVCIASCYSGIFKETGLLDFVIKPIRKIEEKAGSFSAFLVSSIFSSCVACNQTLAIMMTNQLCDNVSADAEGRAIFLENTAVVVAPLIPWSIAGTVPLTSSGAPMIAIAGACYLYLLPLFSFAWHMIKRKKTEKQAESSGETL